MSKREILFQWIKEGNFQGVKSLVLENSRLGNSLNDEGVSGVLVALYHNEPEIAEFMAGVRTSLNQFETAALGRIKTLRLILQEHGNHINQFSGDGYQALGLAAFFGQAEAARILVEFGAEVNAPSQNRLHVTPLYSATASGNSEIVALLLEHGADANAKQMGGLTPLHAAAQKGQIEMAELLLAHGAEPGAVNDEGKTALQLAVASKNMEMAAFLRKQGKKTE
jgi:uncharacterized protein